MGDSEWRSSDGLVIDEISAEGSPDRHNRHLYVKVERLVLIARSYENPRIWWGMRPTGSKSTVLGLAEDTLFLEDELGRSPIEMIETAARSSSVELISKDGSSSYQISVYQDVFSNPREDGGAGDSSIIYHALLPTEYVPTRIYSLRNTARLVNAKKTPDRRLALTWIASNVLEAQMQIRRANEKRFDELKTGDLLESPFEEPQPLAHFSHQAAQLATSPEVLAAFIETLKTIVH